MLHFYPSVIISALINASRLKAAFLHVVNVSYQIFLKFWQQGRQSWESSAAVDLQECWQSVRIAAAPGRYI